jgi:hypothetical protein
MFIWSSFRSKREFQAISSVITLGFATFLIGWSFEAIMLKNSNLFYHILSAIFIIIGVFIATSPLIGHFELFTSPIVKILIFIMISLLAVSVSLTIFYNLQLVELLLIIIWTAIFALILIVGYLIYFYLRKVESGARKEELQEALRIFTKPLKFGVEDIKYSKEKGFCLVCKNKISKLTYVCPKCEAWYCIICCEALVELKNNCWGCETPFARFAPIKYEN